jgi:hypothetical protein
MSLQQLSAREAASSGLQLVRMQRLFVALIRAVDHQIVRENPARVSQDTLIADP